ncbi:ketosteroid isomerase-like protein [Lachnospiraceae bacterium PF1-21]
MRSETVLQFVKAINNQNVPALIEMMADDFAFIDTYGDTNNKEQMKTGWQGYFDWFPDYLIEISDYLENDEFAVIIGRASGSYKGDAKRSWSFPAVWKVVVRDEQVVIWQVFCDSKKQLDSMI